MSCFLAYFSGQMVKHSKSNAINGSNLTTNINHLVSSKACYTYVYTIISNNLGCKLLVPMYSNHSSLRMELELCINCINSP